MSKKSETLVVSDAYRFSEIKQMLGTGKARIVALWTEEKRGVYEVGDEWYMETPVWGAGGEMWHMRCDAKMREHILRSGVLF